MTPLLTDRAQLLAQLDNAQEFDLPSSVAVPQDWGLLLMRPFAV
jgi:hypothetical protein